MKSQVGLGILFSMHARLEELCITRPCNLDREGMGQ